MKSARDQLRAELQKARDDYQDTTQLDPRGLCQRAFITRRDV